MNKTTEQLKDKAVLTDDIQVVHTLGAKGDKPVERKTYVVTDKAARPTLVDQDKNLISNGSNGIARNGRVYKPGDEIELDDISATNFLALGEVKKK